MLSLLNRHDILYAEDDPSLRATMGEYLKLHFRRVYLCENGKEALALYRAHRPAVMLLDIDLPKIDGLKVAAAVRDTDPHCRILMLTAYTDTPKLLEDVELKLTRYLVKPVSPAAFAETLRRLAFELGTQIGDIVRLADSLVWNAPRQRLYTEGKEIILTEKERRLLRILIEHHGRCVGYETIINLLWDDAYSRAVTVDAVKRHVSSLRRKLPGARIESVYGQGYLLH